MEWISCTERLPEKSGRYLVTRGSNVCGGLFNKVGILNYSDLMGLKKEKIWWSGNVGKSDFERFDDVIAWQPLPEPYKTGIRLIDALREEFGDVKRSDCFGCEDETTEDDIDSPFDDSLKRWLDKEHDEKILNDSEKKYLSAVIKPFRDRVSYICKLNSLERYGFQCIDIGFTDESIDMELPIFESGTMYKGMKFAHTYTLEELGI